MTKYTILPFTITIINKYYEMLNYCIGNNKKYYLHKKSAGN